jgi:precorrin-2 dehydrogenase/sirohydrochlorin ferrochelatase
MNELYPIFLKTDQLQILIIGGGKVALEKLSFLLKSSPNSQVSLISPKFIPEIREIIEQNGFDCKLKRYSHDDLIGKTIVIGATDDDVVNKQIYQDAKQRNILVNIADNPPLCDFYMGGIVTKGNLKLAISTNGKSPTMAKRLRQYFEEFLPESTNDLLNNLNIYRKELKEDFEFKVNKLNNLTKSLIHKSNQI